MVAWCHLALRGLAFLLPPRLFPSPIFPSSHSPQEARAYPGPMVELNFWSERAANLNSIHDQLSGAKIQKVVQILELAQSTYFPAFQVWQSVPVLTPACCAISWPGLTAPLIPRLPG